MAIAFAFLAAVLWGGTDFLGGYAAKRDSAIAVTLLRETVEAVAFGIPLLIFGGVFHADEFIRCMAVGLAIGAALAVFFNALANGRMAVVAPVAGVVSAIVPIVSGVISGERPSISQTMGLILAIAAVGFVSVQHVDDGENSVRRHWDVSDIVTALLCGCVFGSFFVVTHHTSDNSGAWPLLTVTLGAAITLTTWGLVKPSANAFKLSRNGFVVCFVGALVEAFAVGCYYYATHHGYLSITAAIGSLYPVGTALLALVVLKEHLSRVNWMGLAASGACLVCIAVG